MSKSKITVIVGHKGTGKTTLAVHELRKSEKPVLVLDRVGSVHDNIPDAAVELDAQAAARNLVESPPPVLCYRGETAFVPLLLRAARAVGDLCVVLDEVDTYNRDPELQRQMELTIQMARNCGLDLIATAKRPAEFHKLWLSEADVVCAFRCQESGALKRLADHHPELMAAGTLEEFYFLEAGRGFVRAGYVHPDGVVYDDDDEPTTSEVAA